MCRMLGIASQNRISPVWFESFRALAKTGAVKETMSKGHGDGWGIAGYLGAWTVHFGRSAGNAAEADDFASAVTKALGSRSKILVAHLRKASEGVIATENSHPFISGDWIFAHNGTVYDSEKLLSPNGSYEGTTDSERLFKFILGRIERRSVRDYPGVIREAIAEVKRRCRSTSLTFLLSNANHLVGYRDFSEEGEYYTLHYSSGNDLSFLFCSETLPGFAWEPMKNGELIVVDKVGGFLSEF